MTKGDLLTQARFELTDYSTRVLDVFKGKNGLKNREEALNKFIEERGQDLVAPEINEELLIELDNILKKHKKKYPNRTMSEKELNELLEL
ncbi:DUF2683 family protein [Candidatus Woesearchaeota archaeon]|nr:DUF2683 family protein [Candidatus Woesearchaeota archaeon]MCF8012927.1 DUF2683 family protein [Candidatus Woesearchaeota archaeon]